MHSLNSCGGCLSLHLCLMFQRLLEKKNARKRKQEEASAALKNINVQSDAKRSPVKNRHPLAPKNDNDTVGARLVSIYIALISNVELPVAIV